MKERIFARLLPLAVVLMLAGCASSDDGAPDADAITPQESAAGTTWTEPGDDDGDPEMLAADPAPPHTVTTPAEDSSPFLEQEAELPPAQPAPDALDLGDLEAMKACHRATGYRRGKAFTICLTTIDGKYVEVNTARAFLRIRTAARRAGVQLRVNSGFRSMAQQRYLYRCYKTRSCNGGNLAAPPGYSNHQSGHALDLNTSARGVYTWLANHGRAYAFRRTVPSERWHWEY